MSHSYQLMAERLDVGHEGWVRPYLARRWTRRGARNFLIEYWNWVLGSFDVTEPWICLATANMNAVRSAQKMGFRIPSAAFDADRARVLRLAARAGVHLASDYPAIYRWCMKVHR
jgi:hypothetical protein